MIEFNGVRSVKLIIVRDANPKSYRVATPDMFHTEPEGSCTYAKSTINLRKPRARNGAGAATTRRWTL